VVRNVIGGILALAGAASAVLGPFLSWYNGRDGRDYRVADLFNGISDSGMGVWGSLVLPFAFAALVTLVGLAFRSRTSVTIAGLIVIGFTVLWMVRQGQAAGSLAIEGGGSGLGAGVAYTMGGGIALLVAAAAMSGRRRDATPGDPQQGTYHQQGTYQEPYGWYGDGHGRDEPGPYQPR
jgi:hypothetical protein